MKLVLASQGFTTDEIAEKVAKLVGKDLKNINIGIINESYVAISECRSKRWLINELMNIERHIGGIIDFVNLRAYNKKEIERRLSAADLIYIVGGKQLIYGDLFKKTGVDNMLKKLLDTKVIMGTSAGSIVLGKLIDSKYYWKERYNIDLNGIQNNELEFVNFNIIPHYMRKDHKKWNEEFYKKVAEENSFPLYAINDNQAVIYNDGKIEYVGGNPVIF